MLARVQRKNMTKLRWYILVSYDNMCIELGFLINNCDQIRWELSTDIAQKL